MDRIFHDRIRMVVALLLPFAVCAIQWVLWDVFKPFAWFLFFPTVFFSSRLGGRAVGIFTTLVSALLVVYFFMPPQVSFEGKHLHNLYSVAVFVAMGFVFSFTHEKLDEALKSASEALKSELAAREELREARIRLLEVEKCGAEERFRTLFTKSPVAMCFVDRKGLLIDQNERFLYLFGYSADEVPTMADWLAKAYPDPAYREEVVRSWESLAKTAAEKGTDIPPVEYRITRRDGSVLNVLVHGIAIGGDYLIAFVDLTERRRREDELRESAAQLKQAQALAKVGNWSWDLTTGEHQWSEEVYRIYGRDPTLPPARYPDLAEYFTPESWERLSKAVDGGLATGEPYECDAQLSASDDGPRWIVARGHAERNAKGEVVCLYGTFQDISERKAAEVEREKLQHQLMQSQKLESIGRLAGGVAHDFNNMLGVIQGHAEIALEEAAPDDPLREDLSEILAAARRSTEITRQLLAFARKQAVHPQVIDLNDSLGGMLKMLKRLIGEDVDLKWLPGDDLRRVRIDPSQVDQLLANLATNARDAIDGIGTLTISTANVEVREGETALFPGGHPGRFVMLSVSDTGCGIDPEKAKLIFEPFYTTKRAGEGTGLGLSTVFGIVRQNDGFINLVSSPGEGATFQIFLPALDGDVEEEEDEEVGEKPHGGGETILLVEDEAANLRIAEKILLSLGYKVLAAQSPGEALRMAREHAGPIQLLLTDVVMPGMNGRELAETLAKLHPETACLFMSGYVAQVISGKNVIEEGETFLQKPFTTHDLAAKVRSVLGTGS